MWADQAFGKHQKVTVWYDNVVAAGVPAQFFSLRVHQQLAPTLGHVCIDASHIVEIQWQLMHGHIGHHWNELADWLWMWESGLEAISPLHTTPVLIGHYWGCPCRIRLPSTPWCLSPCGALNLQPDHQGIYKYLPADLVAEPYDAIPCPSSQGPLPSMRLLNVATCNALYLKSVSTRRTIISHWMQ